MEGEGEKEVGGVAEAEGESGVGGEECTCSEREGVGEVGCGEHVVVLDVVILEEVEFEEDEALLDML